MIRAWRFPASGKETVPELAELPEPTLSGDQVLIEVEAAVFAAPELAAAARRQAAPTPGGAAVGTVIASGPSAGDAIGARVLCGPTIACGECELCRRGLAVACLEGETLGRTADGALASHLLARARWLCRLEAGLEVPGPAAALLAREAADAYALYARAGVAPGEPVVIVGDDPVARFLAEVGRARGTRPLLIAADADPGEVRAAGAAAGFGQRPWRIFATSGPGRRLALGLAGPGAVLGFYAGSADPDPEPLPVAALLEGSGALLGVAGAHPDLLPEVAALAARGELDLAAVADLVPIAEIDSIVDRARRARDQGRAAVLCM